MYSNKFNMITPFYRNIILVLVFGVILASMSEVKTPYATQLRQIDIIQQTLESTVVQVQKNSSDIAINTAEIQKLKQTATQ